MPGTSSENRSVSCPRCQSSNAMLFRALRSSLVYLCRDCEHQWEAATQGEGEVMSAWGHGERARLGDTARWPQDAGLRLTSVEPQLQTSGMVERGYLEREAGRPLIGPRNAPPCALQHRQAPGRTGIIAGPGDAHDE